MTSEQQDRRALVAESYRYARAFYDGAEATGPAAFERNRQAIIDVIALAYRDGQSSARASDSALRAAARAVLDHLATWNWFDMSEAAQRQTTLNQELRNALDGAPWEPNEEMVERAALGMREANDPGRTFTPAVEDAAMSFYYSMARAALRAAFSPPPAGPPASA